MRRSCEEYEELISEFLDGELSKEDQLQLMKHMSGCSVCQKYFDDLVAVHEAMEDMEEAPVPEGFSDRVMAQVRVMKQEVPAGKKTVLLSHWKRWAALAACCAVAVGGMVAFHRFSGNSNSLQAAVTASMPYTGMDVPAVAGEEGIAAQNDGAADGDGMLLSSGGESREAPAGAAGGEPDLGAGPEKKVESEKALNDSAAAPPLDNTAAPSAAAPEATRMTSGSISEEDAKNAALTHAGLAADEVTFTQTKLEWENGKQVYDVEFFSPSEQYDSAERMEYDYDIDAVTGAVVKYGSERMDSEVFPVPDPALITTEDAKSTALAHAGLTAADVTFTKAKLDWEDGKQVYEVEFVSSGGREYDYEIDAAAGTIIKYDYDAESYAPPVSGETITREQAQDIALGKVPGAEAAHITKLKLDNDGGAAVYEVEIVYNGMEYDMEISASTGEVLEFESEPVD